MFAEFPILQISVTQPSVDRLPVTTALWYSLNFHGPGVC
jgi:hypothetical protein